MIDVTSAVAVAVVEKSDEPGKSCKSECIVTIDPHAPPVTVTALLPVGAA